MKSQGRIFEGQIYSHPLAVAKTQKYIYILNFWIVKSFSFKPIKTKSAVYSRFSNLKDKEATFVDRQL